MTTLRAPTFTESLAAVLVQRKDETQYVGWVAELVKKKAEERVVVVGKWRIYFFSLVKGTAKVPTCLALISLYIPPPFEILLLIFFLLNFASVDSRYSPASSLGTLICSSSRKSSQPTPQPCVHQPLSLHFFHLFHLCAPSHLLLLAAFSLLLLGRWWLMAGCRVWCVMRAAGGAGVQDLLGPAGQLCG